MKKYVVQNLNFAAPYAGNLMNSIFALEKECKKNNIEFIYVFPVIAKDIYWVQEMIDNGKIVYFKPTKKMMCLWKKIIKKYKPAIIHTHFHNLKDSITIRILKLRYLNIRTILHLHSYYFESPNKMKEKIKRIVFKSDMYIPCSEALEQQLKKLKFPNVCCVENAIDYRRLEEYVVLERSDYGIEEVATVFLMFGHDFDIKGVDIAIRATEMYVKDHNAVLAVVAAGNRQNFEKKLKNLFANLPDWLKILPPREDVASYYNMADIFISASRHEGFCYALPEAAYSGCRIIFSDIPGQNHAKNIPNSVAFDSENIISLYEAMNTSKEAVDVKVQKEYVLSRYDLSLWCKKIILAYKRK